MARPGSRCPHCKSTIKYSEPSVDADGSFVCVYCRKVIYPATSEAFATLAGQLPVPDQHTYATKKEYDLVPVS